MKVQSVFYPKCNQNDARRIGPVHVVVLQLVPHLYMYDMYDTSWLFEFCRTCQFQSYFIVPQLIWRQLAT